MMTAQTARCRVAALCALTHELVDFSDHESHEFCEKEIQLISHFSYFCEIRVIRGLIFVVCCV